MQYWTNYTLNCQTTSVFLWEYNWPVTWDYFKCYLMVWSVVKICKSMKHGWNGADRAKPVQVPFSPLQVPCGVSWDWTQVSMARDVTNDLSHGRACKTWCRWFRRSADRSCTRFNWHWHKVKFVWFLYVCASHWNLGVVISLWVNLCIMMSCILRYGGNIFPSQLCIMSCCI